MLLLAAAVVLLLPLAAAAVIAADAAVAFLARFGKKAVCKGFMRWWPKCAANSVFMSRPCNVPSPFYRHTLVLRSSCQSEVPKRCDIAPTATRLPNSVFLPKRATNIPATSHLATYGSLLCSDPPKPLCYL